MGCCVVFLSANFSFRYYQVDLLFKDASIGNAISLAVVHIWILKDKEFGGSKSDRKSMTEEPRRDSFSDYVVRFRNAEKVLPVATDVQHQVSARYGPAVDEGNDL